MLDLVVDVKNNTKAGGGGGGGGRRAAAVLSPGVLRWLRGSGVEEVQIRNLGWEKLLDKTRRKGAQGWGRYGDRHTNSVKLVMVATTHATLVHTTNSHTNRRHVVVTGRRLVLCGRCLWLRPAC